VNQRQNLLNNNPKPNTKKKSPAPKSPAPQPKLKSPPPQKTPKVENEAPKELTKTQSAKKKKREKKEAEEKQKTDEKDLAEKREAALAKKAAKAAEKKKAAVPVPQETQQSDKSDEDDQEEEEEELGDGWEKPKARHTVRIRSPSDKKKAAIKAKTPVTPTESKVVTQVNVPKQRHGQIIGREGKLLATIHQKTGAEIKMPKREGGGTGILISGTAAQVKMAEQIIRDISIRGFSEVTHPGMAGNQIEVEAQIVGRIAGKGAENLKLIQNKSGATVQLPDKKADKQVISIFGKPEEVNKAKEYINALMTFGYCEATHPNWITEEVEFKPENLGRLIGAGGENIQKLCADYNVKIDTPKQDDLTAPQDVIQIKGTQDSIDQAKQAIGELLTAAANDAPQELPAPDPNDPWQQEPQPEEF